MDCGGYKMSYAGSMMGSGIYSEEVTLEVVCAEYNGCDCETETANECKGVWQQDFTTDDWGAINNEITCPICKHSFTFTRERE